MKLTGMLTFLFPVLLNAQTNCLNKLLKETGYTEEQVTTVLMTCNLKLLEGENYLLNLHSAKLRVKLYPRTKKELDSNEEAARDMGMSEKARRIFEYEKCQYVTAMYQIYLKRCERLK